MNAFAVLLLLSPPALLAQEEPFSLPYEYPAYLRHEYNIRQKVQ